MIATIAHLRAVGKTVCVGGEAIAAPSMPARQIAADLERLSQLPELPDRLARILAHAATLARAPRDNADPTQLRRDIQAVCALVQAEYGEDAIPMAERMVAETNGYVFARVILAALHRRKREMSRQAQLQTEIC